MPSKLEILGQLMLSLKNEQNQIMNDINALLNNRDTKEGLLLILNEKIGSLSTVHAKMQETESFIVQLANLELETVTKKEISEKFNNEIDISNEFN